jgi:hypothetical protein
MKGLLGFIWGLFAHHIGTKILSLLLAILLFVFVQQSGQGEALIAEITLRFKLSEDLRGQYVLLDTEVRLSEVRIQGKRSVVEEVAREYALDNTREVTITRAFLGTHARGDVIEITSRLVRDIESRDIDVVAGIDGERIRLDDKEVREYKVEVAPGQEEKLQLGKNSPYLPVEEDGELVKVTLVPDNVRIEGPKSAFRGDTATLLVRIPDLDEALRTVPPAEGDEPVIELPVDTTPDGYVDWDRSGFNVEFLGYLIVNNGTRDMTDQIFEQTLRMQFRVRAQVVSKTLDRVPIVVRRKVDGDVNVAGLNVLSNVVNQTDMDRQEVSLPLRMPAALAERLDQFGDNLVLVLDVTRARQTDTSDTDLEVPIYLDFRDRAKGRLEDLRRISIDIEGELTAIFTKKE